MEHNGRTLRVRPDRPQNQGGRSTPQHPPPPMMMGFSGQGFSGMPMQMMPPGARWQNPITMPSMGQAFSQGYGPSGQEAYGMPDHESMFGDSSRNGSIMERVLNLTEDDPDDNGSSLIGSQVPSRSGSGDGETTGSNGMPPTGFNRPSPFRQGIPHPGRIVMPTYPNFGHPLSPLQNQSQHSGRAPGGGMSPMTPSMPGYTFHAYPATPPLHPLSFLSPGLGPFSPTMMTPGSPINFAGGFNPFHSAAPGAPIGAGMRGGQETPLGHPNGNQQLHGGGEAEYFPRLGSGGGENYFGGFAMPEREGASTPTPLAAAAAEHIQNADSTDDVDPFVVDPNKAIHPPPARPGMERKSSTTSTIDFPTDAAGAESNPGDIVNQLDRLLIQNDSSSSTTRDSRASFNHARPEGLSNSILLDRDRRASLDDSKRGGAGAVEDAT